MQSCPTFTGGSALEGRTHDAGPLFPGDREGDLLLVSYHYHREGLHRTQRAQRPGDLLRGGNRVIAQLDNHVAGLDTGLLGGRILDHRLNQHAILDAEELRELLLRIQRFALDSQHGIPPGYPEPRDLDAGRGKKWRRSGVRDQRTLSPLDGGSQGLPRAVSPNGDLHLAADGSLAHQVTLTRGSMSTWGH